ncbi:MAG: hypothetical protein KIT73_09175 [Burkholderiales bacterium]|nr:hypothetical protein [Burkholderiales bacterium]
MASWLRIDPQVLWARQNVALGLMLLALHLAVVLDIGSNASRAFLLAHFGLFLLWQPVWQDARRLVPSQVLLVVAGGVLLAWWSSWWLLGLWIAVLFSLIGGNVPAMRTGRRRLSSLLAALYLLGMLLVGVVPNLLPAVDVSAFALTVIRYGLVIPVLAIPFLGSGMRLDRPRYAIDLVYSVLLFLLVVVLVLGAFFVQQVSPGDYTLSLAKAVLAIAAIMMVMSWLWDPRGGFAGFGQVLSRYFLSLGMPFERWMHSLANLAEREADPERFLRQAVQEMLELPWLSAVEWSTAQNHGGAGAPTASGITFTFGGLTLRLYTTWRPSPALARITRLLARLVWATTTKRSCGNKPSAAPPICRRSTKRVPG